MKINNDECLIRWNEFNYFSQSLFIAKLTCNVLENLGKTSILINQYLDFLLSYKDNVQYFCL